MQLISNLTMSYQDSPYSGPADEYDFDDDGYEDSEEPKNQDDSFPPLHDETDEGTDEASETDTPFTDEPVEIKERMYQDKLSNLKKQLQQLEDGNHPDFMKRVKKLEHQLHERLRINRIYKDHMYEVVEREFVAEKKAAAKEFEEKKIELKENLINDFEEKKKMIENERLTMELNGDSTEVKPVTKRKLRPRPNEPIPAPEKRRKPLTTTLTFQLDDREIDSDLRAINRGSSPTKHHSHTAQPRKHLNSSSCESPIRETSDILGDTRVEDGKLMYERKWFHRGQSVYVEGRDLPKFPGHIHAITDEAIWIKKTNLERVRIFTSQLAKGKVTIKRRAS